METAVLILRKPLLAIKLASLKLSKFNSEIFKIENTVSNLKIIELNYFHFNEATFSANGGLAKIETPV